MAASAAITLAVKAAAVAVTDKRARTAIASVVVAVFLPFILMTFMILGALDGTSTHNFSAVDLSFHGGTLSEKVPEEYQEYIEDIRKSFQNLDSLIASVDNLEGGEIDASRVKAWFYALYFGEGQPSRRVQKDFLECFLRYEERTREVEEEDGSITEETYTVAIFLTDQGEICRNLESLLGMSLAMETRANAQRIYTMAVYGRAASGNFAAGEAMGDGSYGALFAEASRYIGYPYVWGGSSPSTSFDCSGFVCWVFTNSGVHNLPRTTAQGIYNQCTPVSATDAKAGDIIFFTGTYNSGNPVTHVGIYCGNGVMIHAGDPIKYSSINTSYWQSHYFSFGRLN